MIESAGYQHLYGIAPVLNALKANVRDFATPVAEEEVGKEDMLELRNRLAGVDGIDNDDDDEEEEFSYESNNDDDDGNDGEFKQKEKKKKVIKPEAALSPHLFIQAGTGTLDNSKRSFRSNAKKDASAEILKVAKENELPIVEVDKGVLNTLCSNRPHQGFVLRCGKLDFETVRKVPAPDAKDGPALWLALDEVVDPQNLGKHHLCVFEHNLEK